jgi:multicomponent Na+:H+ antiporter subunit D
MSILLILPLIIPLVTAATSLLFRQSREVPHWLAVAGASAMVASSAALLWTVWHDGILAGEAGGWPAPYGITLVADLFSAIMVLTASVVGLLTIVYAIGSLDEGRRRFGFYPITQVLLMGVCGTFLTGDMFNLYVWFEVMLIASFVLLALGGEQPQMEGAIKYVALNLVASVIFLMAVGLLYGMAGTLNMADLSLKLRATSNPGLVTAVAMMFLVAFGIKAAIFPLFFWLPASYHTPPVVISAIFAALLTKVGAYSMIRVFTLIFTQDIAYTHTIILVLAGLTMVTGVLGAVAQYDMRRLLSFHIVSQIGYLLMGLGLMSPLALAGAIYFMVHVILAKTALFLIGGIIWRQRGSYQLRDLGGIYASRPALALMFLVPAFSLAGVPPLSGFFGKLALIQAGLQDDEYLIVAVALAVGVLTLFSMIKIWNEAFWKNAPDDAELEPVEVRQPAGSAGLPYMYAPVVALVAIIIALGLAAGPLYEMATVAGEQLIDPDAYIAAVMEGE